MSPEHPPEAVFATFAEARAAADAAMPRRKHHRPYPQSSGWHWARSLACPVCGAAEGVECSRPPEWRYQALHAERQAAARAAGLAAERWIVLAYPNTVLLVDGTMYDHQRRVRIRP